MIEQLSKLNGGVSNGVLPGSREKQGRLPDGQGVFASILQKQGDGSFASETILKVVTASLPESEPGENQAQQPGSQVATDVAIPALEATSDAVVASKETGRDLKAPVQEPVIQRDNWLPEAKPGVSGSSDNVPGNVRAGQQPIPTVEGRIPERIDDGGIKFIPDDDQQEKPVKQAVIAGAGSSLPPRISEVDQQEQYYQPGTGAMVTAEALQPAVVRGKTGISGQALPAVPQAITVAGVAMVSYPGEQLASESAARPVIGDQDKPGLVAPVTLQAEQRQNTAAVIIAAASPAAAVEVDSEASAAGQVKTNQLERNEGSQRESRLFAVIPPGMVKPGAVVTVQPGSNPAGQVGGGGLTAVEPRPVVGREGSGLVGETAGPKVVAETDQASVVSWEPASRLGTARQPVNQPGSPAIAVFPEATTWSKTSRPGPAQGEYPPLTGIATRHPVVIEQAAISRHVPVPGSQTVTDQVATNLPEYSSRVGAGAAGEKMLKTNEAVLPEVEGGQPQYQQKTGIKSTAAEQWPVVDRVATEPVGQVADDPVRVPASAVTAELIRLARTTVGAGEADGTGTPQQARAGQGSGAAQARPEAVAAQENSGSRKTINKLNRQGIGTTPVALLDSKPAPVVARTANQLAMLIGTRYATGGAGKDGNHGSISVNQTSENQVVEDPVGLNAKRANSILEKPLLDTLMMYPSVVPKEPSNASKPESLLPQPQLEPLIETLRIMLRQGRSRAEVELNPPQWGKVQLAVEVVRPGLVTIRLLVEQDAASRALQAQIPQLRQAMAEQGIQIQQIDVSLAGGQHWAGNAGYGQQQTFTGRNGQRKMMGQKVGVPIEAASAAPGAGHSGIDYRV